MCEKVDMCPFKNCQMQARKKSRISLLEREITEQLETIQDLWSTLGLPGSAGLTSPPKGDETDKRIRELEKILRQKKKSYAKLEEEIANYIINVETYEQQLMQNEQERARLLSSFEKVADPNGSDLTIGDLEGRVERYHEEFRELKVEKDTAMRMASLFKEKLKKSVGRRDTLRTEKLSLSTTDMPGNLHQVLINKQMKVQELRDHLEDSRKLLNDLLEDNQMLRSALSDSDST